MKVAMLQLDSLWASPTENLRRAEALISSTDPADLYVLPEMWATGFVISPEDVADDETVSEALAWMKDMAYRRSCALCGSLSVRVADGTYRNRLYFVTPQKLVFYDKRHLFSHGHENEHYTAGTQAVVAEWGGMRFLLQICYDLRFPVFSRYGRAGEYDAIIYVANWPQSRMLAWETLTRARAIENQCYVVAVNRVGDDPSTTYVGGSVAIEPTGQILASCSPSRPGIAVATLDLGRLRLMRQRFRVLEDRD